MIFDYELIRHFEGTYFTTFFISINHRTHHWHSDFELLLPIEGSVIVNTAQEQFVLNKDDLFLINQNEIHSVARTKDNNTILAIQFDPKFCKTYFPNLQRLKFLVKQITREEYPGLWDELRKSMTDIVMDYFRKDAGYQLKLMSTLNMLIYRLLRDLKYEIIDEDRLYTEDKNLTRLNRMINYIQNKYMNKISLKDLAEHENLDMYYLSHFFKKQLGISFQEYVSKVRLEKALELITNTSKTHLDICLECGFSDYRYLSKLFLKEYGCTPLQYKTEYKELHPVFLSTDYGEQHRFIDKKEALDKFIQYLNK